QVGGAEQVQVFDVVGQDEIYSRIYAIDALAGLLDYRVAGIIDVVGIDAEPASHDVDPQSSVEYVEDRCAVQNIVVGVAIGGGGCWCDRRAVESRDPSGADIDAIIVDICPQL